MEPLILHVSSSRKSSIAKSLLKDNDRLKNQILIKEKTNATSDKLIIYPALQFGDKYISGLDGIIDVASKIAKGETLEDIFGFKKEYKTETNKLRDREKIALGLGFLIGGTYLHMITGFFGSFSFLIAIVVMIAPLVFILAWPYMWPTIKKELKNIRVKNLKEMDEENKL